MQGSILKPGTTGYLIQIMVTSGTSLPRHIYRFEPSTGVVQVLDDGFVQLNGIELSPDYKTLYVSDTGAQETELDLSRPATIYAYDIVDNKRLENKRLFAFADSVIPDGTWTPMITSGQVAVMVCISGTLRDFDCVRSKFIETSNNFAFAPGRRLVLANTRL
ncbi:Hypothetical protein PHPALM_6495 [Phytophthora palmivora]|uniref:SMP-30/Gluconolactonase/LRE-like region domain-containing protein n=1 Tax=Phytophthora palmivora TaxID=4796 RepID=A0A2P4YEN6_9STRA|nr:Hypothetical protein PHPALM_6495 [Phytophthora palmivora]